MEGWASKDIVGWWATKEKPCLHPAFLLTMETERERECNQKWRTPAVSAGIYMSNNQNHKPKAGVYRKELARIQEKEKKKLRVNSYIHETIGDHDCKNWDGRFPPPADSIPS